MNKKILLGISVLCVISLFSCSIAVTGKSISDPENDVIVVPSFQYSFELEKASLQDLDVLEYLEYYHTSEKSGLDLKDVDITEEEDTFEITFELNDVIEKYPYTGRNAFFIGIIIVDEDYDGFGAVHVKQSLLEINKYAKYLDDEISGVGDFTYSHREDEITFLIPSTVFTGTIKHIYAVIGEADINHIDIENISFSIENIRIDLYPNSLYGADDSDYPENADVDDKLSSEESIDPYLIGITGAIAIVSIITIPSILNKKK
ncbi:MAG: hypothetical protein ACFFDH_13805 [Promethearchaeota archaeon]